MTVSPFFHSRRRAQRVYKNVVKCLHLRFFFSRSHFGDEIMSNWIPSASTLLNENISGVTFFSFYVVGGGVERSKDRNFRRAVLRWCDVLFDVVKSMQKIVYSETMRYEAMTEGGCERDKNCRIHIAVYPSTFPTWQRGLLLLDKFVLMFHSGFAGTCQSTLLLLMDNSSSRLMKLCRLRVM